MARGRPATPVGSWGEIHSKQLNNGRWNAETRLRLYTGESVRIRARGQSKSAATNALKAKCAERLGASDTHALSTTSPVKDLLDYWVGTKTKVRPQTRDRYQSVIDVHLHPAFGELRINELTPARLDAWLQAQTSGVASSARTVLKGATSMATRYGLMPADPMAVVQAVEVEPVEARALDVEEIPAFRAQIAKSGNETLIDVTDFSLATGLRAGEVLALLFADTHVDEDPPVMYMTGTLVYSSETGHIRQSFGKSDAAGRPIQLPAIAVEIIRRRQEKYGALPMVFPSGAGTFIWENNFNRWLRDARGEKFNWVTIHTLRKTLASLVADELGPHKAADVLGHADSRLTERVYYERNRRGVPIGEVVDGVLKVSK